MEEKGRKRRKKRIEASKRRKRRKIGREEGRKRREEKDEISINTFPDVKTKALVMFGVRSLLSAW
jgi:hypothetical protein